MDATAMQQTTPLYKQSYSDASVLVCRIVDEDDDLSTATALEQLRWLHRLHVAIDHVLRTVNATKVDMTGEVMHFVSGTENGDEDHAASLVSLAHALMTMSADMTLPTGQPLQLQMGLHSGQLVTGVVGNLALKYGVFGTTVTVARQLESLSSVGTLEQMPGKEGARTSYVGDTGLKCEEMPALWLDGVHWGADESNL
ncbi:hypothetical protein WJX75_007966 [Coccomyxa subellipsoidea]|uniref:Guanylate cyclase domain-containing protein n=1 Tax=Coccomyxa subellipsoidea TaxID=248742 RepID=A0ABR2YQ52_9CHLO